MAIKLSIGKPKETVKSLANELKQSELARDVPIPTAPLTAETVTIPTIVEQSPLAIAMNKPEPEPVAMAMPDKDSLIPDVTAEKYALLAEASDTLSQATLDEFNLRMNYVVSSMDNPELPDAMKRVLEYCQAHNELRIWLREEDIAIFVRGARASYAKVAATKSKNRKSRSKKAVLDMSAVDDLMDLDMEI